MKKIVVMVCFCVAARFSAPAFAQEKTTTSTEDLVKAAKASKENQKKHPPTKVITNKDVKQSKGKLVVTNKAMTPVPKTDPVSPIAKQDAQIRARKDAEVRVEKAQKNVDSLQKELDGLEQAYYAENDPNYRDQVIQKRFAQTKRQLDAAHTDLANARDALQKIEDGK